ncbi:MAG TPA: DNA mismatch repair protein MutS [Candidatus Acidoferrales bacterium]
MRQYHAIKKQYPQALVFFRLGDFYELFYEDAIVASRELQIVLTSRNKEKGVPVPMCGVPYHAAESYLAKLVHKGYKVAICEQLEEPGFGKKLVKRDVVRVVTPGTALGTPALEPKENNFLAALAVEPGAARCGLAYVDLSTGDFHATEFQGADCRARTREELDVLRPRELLVAEPADLFSASATPDLDHVPAAQTRLEEWVFASDYAERILSEQFAVATLAGFGLSDHPLATAACGAVVHYLRETQRSRLQHLDRIAYYERSDALVLDQVSVRNLELIEPIFGNEPHATLRDILDETVTSMGARLLRSWILRPSLDRSEIEARLGAVEELRAATVAREQIRAELGRIADLERLLSRITLGTAAPRDLVGLGQSLASLPLLRDFLGKCRSKRLQELHDELDDLADVRGWIEQTLVEDPPAALSEGGVIRAGCDAELDELREISQNSKRIIARMEERERKRTGIASLKIRFNNIFGYYIEVSKPNLPNVPPDYERKQTLVNAERFTTPELKDCEQKILEADERMMAIEQRIFTALRDRIAGQASRIRRTASAIARIDVLANFARLAAGRRYSRPQFNDGGEMTLVAARHPVVEKLGECRGERFIPNDLYLNDSTHQILIITGPNMGGKSTYLRQAALIVIMAQMGCFVPAEQARLPIMDRIFTRIGASDSLARGRSTFLVEMTEVASILNTATPRSLILLDEVGRGTATFDGLSIAWAVVEYLHALTRARTLFATHYHELTELEELLPAVKNVHVSVQESGSDIIFLRKVEPGSADRSYGIEVARLAGLPGSVIQRAREILRRHEESERELTEELSPGAKPPAEAAFFTPLDQRIVDALRQADLDNLKPLEALNLLAELKRQIS